MKARDTGVLGLVKPYGYSIATMKTRDTGVLGLVKPYGYSIATMKPKARTILSELEILLALS